MKSKQTEELRQYVEQKVQEANKILEKIESPAGRDMNLTEITLSMQEVVKRIRREDCIGSLSDTSDLCSLVDELAKLSDSKGALYCRRHGGHGFMSDCLDCKGI